MSEELQVSESFWSRLHRLHSAWRNDFGKDCGSLLLLFAKRHNEEFVNDQICLWLTGYLFPNSAIVLRESSVTFITSKNATRYVSGIPPDSEGTLTIEVVQRNKADSFRQTIESTVALLREAGDGVAVIDEPLSGKYVVPLLQQLKDDDSFKLVDAYCGCMNCMLAMDLPEIKKVKCASLVATLALKHFITRMEGIIDKDLKVTHETLSEEVSAKLTGDSEVSEKFYAQISKTAKRQFSASDCELLFEPMVESSNSSQPMTTAFVSTGVSMKTAHLSCAKNDVICFKVGVKLADYHSAIVRTFMISPTKQQKEYYSLLTACYKAALTFMSKHTSDESKSDATTGGVVPAAVFEACLSEIDAFCKRLKRDETERQRLRSGFVSSVGWPLAVGGFELRRDNEANRGGMFQMAAGKSMTASMQSLKISAPPSAVLRTGMAVHFQMGFDNLAEPRSEKKYCLMLADTIRVGAGKVPTFLTSGKRSLTDYTLEDENTAPDSSKRKSPKKTSTASPSARKKKRQSAEDSSKKKKKKKAKSKKKSAERKSRKRKKPDSSEEEYEASESEEVSAVGGGHNVDEWKPAAGKRYLTRGTNLKRQKEMEQLSRDRVERDEKQTALREENKAYLLQLLEDSGGDLGIKTERKKFVEPACFGSPSELPTRAKLTRVSVDTSRQCVLCPIFDAIVPFHISLLKNTAVMQSGEYTYFRMNFLCPVPLPKSGREVKQPLVAQKHPTAQFIKELNFRAKDGENLLNVNKQIREIQKRVKDLEKQKENMSAAVGDGGVGSVITDMSTIRLKKNVGTRVLQLNTLTMKPTFGGRKKGSGRLECHLNGLRYTDHARNELRILFSNVRFAFFQPSKNTPSVYIHFVLKQPVLIGKKATFDVQFSRDVMEKFEDIGRMGGSGGFDGARAERDERRRIAQVNRSFKDFCRKLEQQSSKDATCVNPESDTGTGILFEVPEMAAELSFLGVPNKDRVTLHPTSSCLVALNDSPPFVLCFKDVQLAYFERVQFHLRDFDLVLVLKDLTKAVLKVSIIPRSKLNVLHELLSAMDVMFYTGKQSMDWKEVMKGVRGNFQGFVDEGGWDFLAEADDDYMEKHAGGKKQGADADEYRPAEEELEEESEDEEMYSEGSESEFGSDDFSEASADESEEDSFDEGLSWAEMDRKALADDRRAVQRDQQLDAKMRAGRGPATKRRRRN